MAAQLYSNTKLAECLYEVLSEMVTNGELNEELAVATLAPILREAAARPAVAA